MANDDIDDAPSRGLLSGMLDALATTFGRSKRQIEYVKGKEQGEEKYYHPETVEQRISKMFYGYTDLQYDRQSKYRDYDRMDMQSTECQVALDIYAEEASQKDNKTNLRAWISSEDDPGLAAELNGMFQRIRLEAKIYGVYRNLVKYGDVFMYLRFGPYGVHDMLFIHPSRVDRVQEDGLLAFKCDKLAEALPMDNRVGLFKPWDMLHWKLSAFDNEGGIFGRSLLESLRKVWKQYTMLQTMLVLYRIARAVQRNVFYIDVGQAGLTEVAGLVKQYQQFLRQKTQFIEPRTKDFKVDFDPAIFMQDIVWPVRAKSQARVEPLYNQSPIGPTEDLEHFKNQMRVGLGIPKDYFDGEYGGAWNSREALMLQDVRFSRKIQKYQDAMREGLVRVCQIHWAIVHQEYLDPSRFDVDLGTISEVAERQREDVLLRKSQILEILGNFAVTMEMNRRAWMSYLFDEIFPLDAKLRAKLLTPDPIDMENLAKEVLLQKNVHKKSVKPPQRATADNIRKGFRSFSYGEAVKSAADQILEGDVEAIVGSVKMRLKNQGIFPIKEVDDLANPPGLLLDSAIYNDFVDRGSKPEE